MFECLRCFWVFSAPVLYLVWFIKHRVDSAQLSAPKKINAPLGGQVTVSCGYDPQFRENSKYWCRGPVYGLCKILVKTPTNRKSDRVFITDDKDAGVFNVTMTLLRERDAGMYWCVIATSGRNVHTGVRLQVSLSGIPKLILWALINCMKSFFNTNMKLVSVTSMHLTEEKTSFSEMSNDCSVHS